MNPATSAPAMDNPQSDKERSIGTERSKCLTLAFHVGIWRKSHKQRSLLFLLVSGYHVFWWMCFTQNQYDWKLRAIHRKFTVSLSVGLFLSLSLSLYRYIYVYIPLSIPNSSICQLYQDIALEKRKAYPNMKPNLNESLHKNSPSFFVG